MRTATPSTATSCSRSLGRSKPSSPSSTSTSPSWSAAATSGAAPAVRAAELNAEAVLKGTHSGVDGIYTADPRKDPTATRLDEISYMDALNQGLNVMDTTALTFCMDNSLPIVVFDVLTNGNLRRV